MGESRVNKLRDEGLTFFGKVTAGQSHEVTNVLNIINELAGLQQDVLEVAELGKPVNVQKLKELGDKIQFQVKRGAMIIRNINRFAHSVDSSFAMFDVKEVISRTVFLAERWTRLNNVALTADLPEETTALENSPFFFQQAVFLCIDAALLAVANPRRVTVSYSVIEDGAEIVVISADPLSLNTAVEMKVITLRALLDELGGELRVLPSNRETDRFVFYIPGERRQRHNTTGSSR